MTLNTYIAGEPASGHTLADFLTHRADAVQDKATGWHEARKTAESEWDGPASDAFVANRAMPNGRDADALERIDRELAQPFTAWGDGITAAKQWMERAKDVARNGELIVLANAICPPKSFEHLTPDTPMGTNTGENNAEAAKALHAKQKAAFDEAKALVQQARDLERKAHAQLRDALTKQTEAIRHLGQYNEWSQVAGSAKTDAATDLMAIATDLENKSVHATHAAFEKAVNQGPHATSSMWSALTSEQRADLISRYPQMVGNTNGVPVVDRDAANRSILAAQRQTIVNRIEQLKREYERKSKSEFPPMTDGTEQLNEALAAIDKLEGKLGSSAEESGYYLLGIDGTADSRGRAIVAHGNPDTADHVMTSVPGTGADLGGVLDNIENNDAIRQQAIATAAGKQEIATIAWNDYETPETLAHAGQAGYAERAAPNLAEFQEGLRATHEGPPSHNTLLGHSYGSTTAGYAARDHNVHADDIAFIGSPGVGVEHARELGMNPENVWSGTSRSDEIAIADWNLGLLDPLDGHENQWHGLSPSDPDFGSNTIPTDPTGSHGDYWSKRPSLEGMARIVNGTAKEQG